LAVQIERDYEVCQYLLLIPNLQMIKNHEKAVFISIDGLDGAELGGSKC
jgi:hypothetical protein